MKPKDFDRLIDGVKQFVKIKAGEMKPSRVFEFSALDVKALRESLHKSLEVFNKIEESEQITQEEARLLVNLFVPYWKSENPQKFKIRFQKRRISRREAESRQGLVLAISG